MVGVTGSSPASRTILPIKAHHNRSKISPEPCYMGFFNAFCLSYPLDLNRALTPFYVTIIVTTL